MSERHVQPAYSTESSLCLCAPCARGLTSTSISSPPPAAVLGQFRSPVTSQALSRTCHLLHILTTVGAILAPIVGVTAGVFRSAGVKLLLLVLALLLLTPTGFLFLVLPQELCEVRHRTYKAFCHHIQLGMTNEGLFAFSDRHHPPSGLRDPLKTGFDQSDTLVWFMSTRGACEPHRIAIAFRLGWGRG